MSETALTVPTAFQDIAQLAEGFADRVDEGRLMLYGPEHLDEGATVHFAVTLEDGSHALEGAGQVITSIDGGEERPEVARFDVLIGELQLDGASQAIYERILMMRSEAFQNDPATGEVSLEEVEQVEQQADVEVAYETDESTQVASVEEYAGHVEASAGQGDWSDDPHSQETVVGDGQSFDAQGPDIELDAVAADDELVVAAGPADPGGFGVDPTATNGGVLARPSRQVSWAPEAIPTPEARPEGGVFAYTGGLPIPPSAPRPELDPAYCISPAPRPEDGAGAVPQVEAYGDPVDGGGDLEVAEELEIDEGMVE